jgi:hypothetical protein
MILTIFLAAAAIGTLIVVVLLCWKQILGWFRNKQELMQEDKDNMAVMVRQSLANGKIREIHGVFNKATEEILDGEQYEAEQLDEELEKVFGNEDMVVLK